MPNTTWTLYLIENKTGNLYCGICTDVQRRFSEHQKGGKLCAKALRGKGPLRLKFAAKVGDRSAALKQEYWLKKQSRKYKLSVISGTAEMPFNYERYSDKLLERIVAAEN